MSEKETEEFAREFSKKLKAGTIIGLSGNLGAGKTHFIKGLASAYGIKKDDVVSPTFTIMREYHGESLNIYHFDFYRLNGEREVEAIGFRDFASDESSIICVEWPEIEKSVYKMYDIIIKILHVEKNSRKIKVYIKA